MMTTIDTDEKIAREIAKTSDSIRKKYQALKTGKMEEDLALERHFKPITEPLKQIVEQSAAVESLGPEIESLSMSEAKDLEKDVKQGTKRTRSLFQDSLVTSTPNQLKRKRRKESLDDTSMAAVPLQPATIVEEDVFETTPESFVSTVQRQLQTAEGQNTLREHFGPLGQQYISSILSQDKNSSMDYVYGVKFTNEGMMLGDKRFDVDNDDNIFIDGIKYLGTPGLYELIFKRIPDDAIYTEEDKNKYKSILLATNAHRRGSNILNPVLGNKGFKYKYIIGPLTFDRKTGRGIGIPLAMTLNNNKIDYVHWNDPNELVDRLRLLEASRHAGNNAHDNEIMSIIEELREAGLIIN